jgi:gluconate 2-dehydrogenase
VIATNTPDVSTESVADFAWALMLAAARRVGDADRFTRSGAWTGFAYSLFLGTDLHGTTLGIIGMGRIGQAIAQRAVGFGMVVLYCSRSPLPPDADIARAARRVDKETLLRMSDHVVLALSYGADSHHLVGAPELALMKPSATLVNIARGGVVDDAALADALHAGRIAAAALDVFETEPAIPPALRAAPNLLMTPHMASASIATRRALADLAVDNLIAALGHGPSAGRPPSILNPSVLKPPV